MLRPAVTLAAAGVVGFALWKVLSFLLIPLLGTMLGFVFMLVKIGLVVALVFFLIWFFRKNRGEETTPD